MTEAAILWRRLDRAGHESARLVLQDAWWRLSGTAVFAEGREPCRLDYAVVCDRQWRTTSASVSGWVGARPVAVDVAVDAERRWRLGGADCSAVAGCVDVDLEFSPSTNLLPIRRLALAVGEEAAVRAAWLRFPGFTLEPLEQRYRREAGATYRYESAGGRFVTRLLVNAEGFVTHYPDAWRVEPDR